MIKGYLYLLLGLYKFKENHSQIFFFISKVCSSYLKWDYHSGAAQSGVEGKQNGKEAARAGKIYFIWQIYHLWSMNVVLVPVI